MVVKSWGRQISGPVLVVASIVVGIIAANNSNNTGLLKIIAWCLAALAAALILVAQRDVWSDEHALRITAENKLASKIRIGSIHRREWPDSKTRQGLELYFDVHNDSGTTLHGCEVKLVRMIPREIEYLPAHLHLKHDNKPPMATEFVYATKFDLNPDDIKQVDLATGPLAASSGAPRQPLVIVHNVIDERTTIRKGTYEITVCVTAEDSKAESASFVLWIDSSDEMQCRRISPIGISADAEEEH